MNYTRAKFYTMSSSNINTTHIFQFSVISALDLLFFNQKCLKRPITAGAWPSVIGDTPLP